MKILITGVGGFAGSHLADHLYRADPALELWGCDRSGVRQPYHPPTLRMRAVNLLDPAATRVLIAEAQPDRIFHLAGQAFVGASWEDPWGTLELNVRAQLNVLEAVRAVGIQPRILIPASMEVYGKLRPDELPIAETRPLRPDSPYGVSKVTQELLGLQYHWCYGLPIVSVRPFNHIGPRQNNRFVVPAFASQIAAIEAGHQPPVLRVGNLSARRDFTDVRDMVWAYALALEQATPGEVYNVGSGQSHSIQTMLDGLLACATVQVAIEIDPARLRPSDVPDVVCDASKFRATTGWAPRISIEQTLRAVLDYERQQLIKSQN